MSLYSSNNSSLLFYKGTGYGEVNDLLRQGTIPIDPSKISTDILQDPTIKHIINIDSSMKNNKIYKNQIFYRGIRNLKSLINEQGIVVNKAYSSCSFDIDVAAKNFSYDKCCVVAFTIPDEIKYHEYISSGMKDSEKEILIQRNTQFINFDKLGDYNGVQYYSCSLKLYYLPIISNDDMKKQECINAIFEAKRKEMLEDDDDEFERMLAEDD